MGNRRKALESLRNTERAFKTRFKAYLAAPGSSAAAEPSLAGLPLAPSPALAASRQQLMRWKLTGGHCCGGCGPYIQSRFFSRLIFFENVPSIAVFGCICKCCGLAVHAVRVREDRPTRTCS
eukprot:4094791-Amphidinium_carterae.1